MATVVSLSPEYVGITHFRSLYAVFDILFTNFVKFTEKNKTPFSFKIPISANIILI